MTLLAQTCQTAGEVRKRTKGCGIPLVPRIAHTAFSKLCYILSSKNHLSSYLQFKYKPSLFFLCVYFFQLQPSATKNKPRLPGLERNLLNWENLLLKPSNKFVNHFFIISHSLMNNIQTLISAKRQSEE